MDLIFESQYQVRFCRCQSQPVQTISIYLQETEAGARIISNAEKVLPQANRNGKLVGTNLKVKRDSMYLFNATLRESAELGHLLIIWGFQTFALTPPTTDLLLLVVFLVIYYLFFSDFTVFKKHQIYFSPVKIFMRTVF